jgi:hypothetical protein
MAVGAAGKPGAAANPAGGGPPLGGGPPTGKGPATGIPPKTAAAVAAAEAAKTVAEAAAATAEAAATKLEAEKAAVIKNARTLINSKNAEIADLKKKLNAAKTKIAAGGGGGGGGGLGIGGGGLGAPTGGPVVLPTPGPYRWYVKKFGEQRWPNVICSLPTSPKPRASLGTIVARVYPPPRMTTMTTRIPPTLQDWIIHENCFVFAWVEKDKPKLNVQSLTSSAKRRRVNVVSNVFSNWKNRSFALETNPDTTELAVALKLPKDYDVRLLGVAYEGTVNPESARKNPDTNGRFTLTPNGIVTAYVCTRQLEKDNAQVGDTLEWVAESSHMSWRQYGPNFETVLVRVFKPSNYEMYTTKTPPLFPVVATFAPMLHTPMEVDEEEEEVPMMPTAAGGFNDARVMRVNVGGGVPSGPPGGVDTYDIRVDGRNGYDPSLTVDPPTDPSKSYRAYME